MSMTTLPFDASPHTLPKSPTATLSVSTLVIGAVTLGAFVPLLAKHVHQLWVRPHYQFFPFVLVGAAVLVWLLRARLAERKPGSATASIIFVGIAWALLATAELLNSSWLAAVSSLFLVLAGLQTLGLARALFPVWCYLWLVIPPPFGLDNTLVFSLQTLTTHWSSSLLDFIGVQHVISGHTMEVGGKRLFVEEACAGVNSLFSILACALFYVLAIRIPPVRAAFLLVASLGWVLVANVARVFLIAYLAARWDLYLAEGLRHDALGLLLFACALGLIWSTNQLILFFVPSASSGSTSLAPPPGRESPSWARLLNRSWLNSWATAGAFTALLVAHLGFYGVPQDVFASSRGDVAVRVAELREDSLPKELLGWKRDRLHVEKRTMSNAFGEHSKTWVYVSDTQHGSASLDYPFASWHELSECYSGQGWTQEPVTNNRGTENGTPAHFCEQKMKKSGLRWGHLLYCQLDSTGQVLTPPNRGLSGSLQRGQSALRRLLAWSDPTAESAVEQAGVVYQCQFFVESFAPLSVAEQAHNRERFFEVYQALRGHLFPADASKQIR